MAGRREAVGKERPASIWDQKVVAITAATACVS